MEGYRKLIMCAAGLAALLALGLIAGESVVHEIKWVVGVFAGGNALEHGARALGKPVEPANAN